MGNGFGFGIGPSAWEIVWVLPNGVVAHSTATYVTRDAAERALRGEATPTEDPE